LPSYLKKFKVGIIPFKLNKFMDSVFPNKFFEYMARGIPIVTTALPELQDYRDLIGYSLSKEEFINNCQDAVNGKFEKFREQYKYIAGNNTWEHRAMLVNEILRDKLKIN
jgi:glycosyltransferase involved in cell wall biosynthesis